MNKKILSGIAVFIIAAWHVNLNLNSQGRKLSGISLANLEALAQIGNNNELPPEDGKTSMLIACYDRYGQQTGSRTTCFSPGYSKNCTATSCK